MSDDGCSLRGSAVTRPRNVTSRSSGSSRSSRFARTVTRGFIVALMSAVVACETLGSVALEGGDFAGAKADAHCDRRFVGDGGQAAAFCQEIVNTVAASQFADDCRAKHRASAGTGPCPRAQIVAGCKLLEKHQDDSVVWDWYYDVSGIIAEAGPNDGPDGGPTFDSRPTSIDDVAAMCADRSRYADGAELVRP